MSVLDYFSKELNATPTKAPPRPHRMKEKPIGTWDCCHPCALLILMLKDVSGLTGASETELETLDCYGYLTPEGKPDVEAAEQELAIWNRRKDAAKRTKTNPVKAGCKPPVSSTKRSRKSITDSLPSGEMDSCKES